MEGTGPRGRIVKADVESFVASQKAAAPSKQVSITAEGEYEDA